MYAVGQGGQGDELHHGDGSDGEHLVELLTGLQQLLQRLGDQTMAAVGAVVGHEDHPVGNRLELLLQNHNVLAAEAHDDGDLCACFLESGCGGQGDGAAHAAANHTDLLLAFHGGGLAQGTHKVADAVTLVQLAQGNGGEADLLENDGNGALFPVAAGDGQGNTLAHLIDAENDELTGSCLPGDEGGFNLHQGNGGIQLFLTNDFIHVLIRPFQIVLSTLGHKCPSFSL